MDGLALLCNLHADGPTTLHHLRLGGCGTLSEVANRRPAELEAILGWTPKRVRRFQREARILAIRLETGVPEPPRDERGPLASVTAERSRFLEEIEGPAGSTADAAEAEYEVDDELDDEIEDEGPFTVARGQEPPPGATADDPSRDEEEREWADLGEPARAVVAEDDSQSLLDRSLSAEVCESLTRDVVRKLAQAGVHTVGDLVDGDVLEIASLVGLGYTRLARIRFLVRRYLDAREVGAGRRVEVIPAPPPTAPRSGAGDRLGASGPFA